MRAKNCFFQDKTILGIRSKGNIVLVFEENSIRHHSVYLKLASVDFLAITIDIWQLKCEPIAIFHKIMQFLAFCPKKHFLGFLGKFHSVPFFVLQIGIS